MPWQAVSKRKFIAHRFKYYAQLRIRLPIHPHFALLLYSRLGKTIKPFDKKPRFSFFAYKNNSIFAKEQTNIAVTCFLPDDQKAGDRYVTASGKIGILLLRKALLANSVGKYKSKSRHKAISQSKTDIQKREPHGSLFCIIMRPNQFSSL